MDFFDKVMLITYPNSVGGNLSQLCTFGEKHLTGVTGSIHLLPFYPSSGDRGFAPLDYLEVDPRFGSWEDVRRLGEGFHLVFDFMINHISRRSHFFEDYLAKGEDSEYADMFIRYSRFWPEGRPTGEDLEMIYRRKPRYPYIEVNPGNAGTERVWCTFDEEQIDLDLFSPATRTFLKDRLLFLADQGPSMIRLDAVPYAVKKPGTSCFFLEPEIWDILGFARDVLRPEGVEVLPEFHEHYRYQFKLADQGYWVYDFALPMLVLHTLYMGSVARLAGWMRICPRKQFTTLDTHDGIGVVDVHDLLSKQEIEETKNQLFHHGANVKKRYNSPEYGNLDIYQINCTYYSALGNNDDAYILARALQYFAPGTPQVYYTGLLAGENDINLVERTKLGRDINRHAYTLEDAEAQLERDVVKRLFALTRFRNTYPGFGGDMRIETPGDSRIRIEWTKGKHRTVLFADAGDLAFTIEYFDPELDRMVRLESV